MMDLIRWFFLPFRALPIHVLLWYKRAARVEQSVFHIITSGRLAKELLVGAWLDEYDMLHLVTGDFRRRKIAASALFRGQLDNDVHFYGVPREVPDFKQMTITDFGDTLRVGNRRINAAELLRLIDPLPKTPEGTGL